VATSTKKVKTRPMESNRYRTRGVTYMDKQLEVEGMQDREIEGAFFGDVYEARTLFGVGVSRC